MKNRRLIAALAAAGAMLVLILDSKTAIAGAGIGVELCIRTLIPALFPFLVVSTVLTQTLTGQPLRILRPIGALCGVPAGAESLMAVGFLGGYPVGARSIAQAYQSGCLSREEAQRMLAFCNNAGPSFLFGIIAPAFGSSVAPWILWAIHIGSAIAVGIITAGIRNAVTVCRPSKGIRLTSALENAVRTMGMICGWVVLFRMILSILQRWILWIFPEPAQILIAGLLELSNGCIQLAQLENDGLRFLAASVILSLGGLCICMQTVSVTAGLSLRRYFPGKLLQCGISFLLCVAAQGIFPAEQQCRVPLPLLIMIGSATLLLGIGMRRSKKSSSNPALVGV